MGFTLLTAPILVVINPAYVPVPMILSGLLLSCFIIIRDHPSMDASGVTIAITGRIIGAIIATLLLLWISTPIFALIFGVMILLGTAMSIIKTSWNPTPSKLFIAGLLSGLMGTLAGVGGPPMGLLYQHQKGSVVRGTLAGFFAIGSTISLILLLIVGKFTLYEFTLFLWILPAILFGFWLSKVAIQILDKGYTRIAILFVSALSAIIIIFKTIIRLIY